MGRFPAKYKYQGARYLDGQTRKREKALRDRQDFLLELEQIRKKARARSIPE